MIVVDDSNTVANLEQQLRGCRRGRRKVFKLYSSDKQIGDHLAFCE